MNKIKLYLIGIIIMLLVISSCEANIINPPPAIESNNAFFVNSANTYNGSIWLYTYVIDSCEYLGPAALNANYAFLAHKGNCKHCKNDN